MILKYCKTDVMQNLNDSGYRMPTMKHGGISYGIMGYTTNMYTIHVMNGG